MNDNFNKIKVIYIMGSGHSGSTLLDVTLGNHHDIQSCGELNPNFFIKGLQENWICSCGVGSQNCQFWNKVIDTFLDKNGRGALDDYKKLMLKFEHKNIFNFDNKETNLEFNNYKYYTLEFLNSIRSVSEKSIIVDSSKNPNRAFAFSLIPEIELVLIHLVRDSRGVTYSYLKKNRSIKSSPLGWLRTNLKSERVYNKATVGGKIRIKYENFVANPTTELKKIEEISGIDLSYLSEKVSYNDIYVNGHLFTGNKNVFMSEKIVYLPDNKWKHQMPYKYQIYCNLVTLPLALKYGHLKLKGSLV